MCVVTINHSVYSIVNNQPQVDHIASCGKVQIARCLLSAAGAITSFDGAEDWYLIARNLCRNLDMDDATKQLL